MGIYQIKQSHRIIQSMRYRQFCKNHISGSAKSPLDEIIDKGVHLSCFFPHYFCSYLFPIIKYNQEMNDLVIDKRIFLQIRRKNNGRPILPEIKYPMTFVSSASQCQPSNKKPHDDFNYPRQMPFRIKPINNELPLSSMLISKRIAPPTENNSPKTNNPKKQNLTSIKKQPSIKVMEIQMNQNSEFQSRAASSSLSRKVHWKIKDKGAINLKNNSQVNTGTTITKNQKSVPPQKSQQLTLVIGRGNNNEQLVRDILLNRKIWKQVQWGECTPHLKWVFSKEKHNYKKMWSFTQTRAINHFEFNEEISAKDNLIKNMQIYCETKKLQLFSLTPVTFIIDFDDEYCEYNIKQFLSFFFKNDPRKQTNTTRRNGSISYNFVNKFQPYMSWQNSDIKKKVNILSRPVNNSTYYSNNPENPSYMWLLKPTGLNRGRGIEIFDSLEQLQGILIEYLNLINRKNYKQNSLNKSEKKQHRQRGKKQEETQQKQSPFKGFTEANDDEEGKPSKEKFKMKNCSFVIQKYVERPLLVDGRKFDIRVWALVTQNFNIYFFKEGYIRTSTETFSTENIDNYYIHLTNNAIQKNSCNYGIFENGNQLPYKDLAKFVGEQQCSSIWERMKQITYMAFSSVKKKINQNNRKCCFELFGIDYIIDAENKVWLIEINENPCLECSSPLLQQLIPRMVNDAFKLTVDQIFDKKGVETIYKVNGHEDHENLWQNMGQLIPNAEYSPKKSPSKIISPQ